MFVGPEREVSDKDVPNAVFRIQTEQVGKDRSTGSMERIVDNHRVFAVGRLAEVILKYLKKGDRVYLDGTLRSKEHPQQSGEPIIKTGIVARNLIMLGGAKREPKNDDVVVGEIDTDKGAGA